MGRSVDISGWPLLAFQYLWLGSAVAFTAASVVLVLGFTLLDGMATATRVWTSASVAFVVVWAAFTAWFVRRVRADGEVVDGGSFWNGVPSDQYLGRFAGRGGLARHSWEKAVEQLPGDDEE